LPDAAANVFSNLLGSALKTGGATMLNANELQAVVATGRTITQATRGDPALGDLTLLPGTWANADNLVGHGWNMIALPYKEPGRVVNPNTPDQKSEFRLLLNQFNETLTFSTVDKGVPNRGAAFAQVFDRDQHLAALQYIQHIEQIAATDSPQTPDTADTPKGSAAIHHEPGLFLHLFSQTDGGPDIARLATIPHGDSVLALGSGVVVNGPPNFDNIGDFSPLPIGVDADVENNPYLAPYKQFKDSPFKNLFDPTNPLALLKGAVQGLNIKTTTVLTFDTSLATGGINNIPFVTKQANASRMRAVFWIEELADLDAQGNQQFILQYAQRVLLDFFPIGVGLIKWPHISINTMKLTARPTS
jgi:hypothetical protein